MQITLLLKKPKGFSFIKFFQQAQKLIFYSIAMARTQNWHVVSLNLDEMLNKHTITKDQKAKEKLF